MRGLKRLLDEESFWAQGRSLADLKKMLRGSDAVVSAWSEGNVVGFGRATSDGIFRAVLWDVVVAREFQGQGVGKRLVNEVLENEKVKNAKIKYVMTTNSAKFYERYGFIEIMKQKCLKLE